MRGKLETGKHNGIYLDLSREARARMQHSQIPGGPKHDRLTCLTIARYKIKLDTGPYYRVKRVYSVGGVSVTVSGKMKG